MVTSNTDQKAQLVVVSRAQYVANGCGMVRPARHYTPCKHKRLVEGSYKDPDGRFEKGLCAGFECPAELIILEDGYTQVTDEEGVTHTLTGSYNPLQPVVEPAHKPPVESIPTRSCREDTR